MNLCEAVCGACAESSAVCGARTLRVQESEEQLCVGLQATEVTTLCLGYAEFAKVVAAVAQTAYIARWRSAQDIPEFRKLGHCKGCGVRHSSSRAAGLCCGVRGCSRKRRHWCCGRRVASTEGVSNLARGTTLGIRPRPGYYIGVSSSCKGVHWGFRNWVYLARPLRGRLRASGSALPCTARCAKLVRGAADRNCKAADLGGVARSYGLKGKACKEQASAALRGELARSCGGCRSEVACYGVWGSCAKGLLHLRVAALHCKDIRELGSEVSPELHSSLSGIWSSMLAVLIHQ